MFGRVTNISVTGLILLAIAGGCDRPNTRTQMWRPTQTALMFDRNPELTLMSTAIDRSDWPASDDGYRLPDYSVYRENYYDTTGNRYNEQNYPRRTTWGYRITGVQR